MITRVLTAAAVCVAVSSAAFAATDVDLAIPVPQNFKVVHQQQNQTQRIMEFIPASQTPENWSDMITYHAARIQAPPPEKMFALLQEQYGKICDHLVVEKAATHTVNGFSLALGSLGCGSKKDNPAEGEYTRFLIVSTPAGMHQVQRAWKGRAFTNGSAPLTAEQQKEWSGFFTGIGLCRSVKGAQPQCEYLEK